MDDNCDFDDDNDMHLLNGSLYRDDGPNNLDTDIDGDGFDRVVLDLPEAWNVVPHAATSLRPGGIILAYTPSVTQVIRLRETLERNGFILAETVEIMQRSWHVEGQAVRPDHRMVAHTAFLTHARLAVS